jgi:hypothetical protein
MSPRAAWRLEALGFTQVYDYVASKIDWFCNGLPREGKASEVPWAGDLARDDIPMCTPGDPVGELRQGLAGSGYDFCLALNEHRILLGLLRGDGLSKEREARAEEVMELGPKTIRPNHSVEKLLESRSNHGIKYWIVTTSHGVLVGVLFRADAESAS